MKTRASTVVQLLNSNSTVPMGGTSQARRNAGSHLVRRSRNAAARRDQCSSQADGVGGRSSYSLAYYAQLSSLWCPGLCPLSWIQGRGYPRLFPKLPSQQG